MTDAAVPPVPPLPLTGQVGLIPDGHGLIPELIDWATRSRVHHVIVAVSETETIGAEPGGARIRPLSYYPNAIWSRFPLSAVQAQDCADWARARENRPYNLTDDLLIGLECITGLTLPHVITDRFDSDDSYQCAQLADAALTKGAGITVFDDGRRPGTVYPGSFELYFRLAGWWTRPDLPVKLQLKPLTGVHIADTL